MATLMDVLAPQLPMEHTHRQMGIENPLLKLLADPINLAGIAAGGAGLGLGMAKSAGRGAAKRAMRESEQAVSRSILSRMPNRAQDQAPMFYSRLARALAAGDPNQRVRTMDDLWKVASKGGGASKGETALFGERLGAIKPLDEDDMEELTGRMRLLANDFVTQGDDWPGESLRPTWAEEIPLTRAARARGAKENTVADLLKEMEDNPPLSSLENEVSGRRYAQYTVPGGEGLDLSPFFSTGAGHPGTVVPGAGETSLLSLLARDPGGESHVTDALSFALTKHRPLAGGGAARSIEQIQSDALQRGKPILGMLQQARPDVAKDLKKRWPQIQLSYELRRAAEEGKQALTWHPGPAVREYNPGLESGIDPFYGPADLSSGGTLADAARKVAKQVPGAEVRPQAVELGHLATPDLSDQVRLRDLMRDTLQARPDSPRFHALGVGREQLELADLIEASEDTIIARSSRSPRPTDLPDLHALANLSRAMRDYQDFSLATPQPSEADVAKLRTLWSRVHRQAGPMDYILNDLDDDEAEQIIDRVVNWPDKEFDVSQRWGITIPPEAAEYLKNNPLRLLGLGGASAAPLSVAAAGAEHGSV